jgi:hypothetical protein
MIMHMPNILCINFTNEASVGADSESAKYKAIHWIEHQTLQQISDLMTNIKV